MNKTIGADAAKLAGLQIDILQKIRKGSLTLSQLQWWLSLNPTTRDYHMVQNVRMMPCYGASNGEFLPIPEDLEDKFSVLADLGIITVPDDYVHETWLDTYRKYNQNKFHCYNTEITDKNFPNPTRVLSPGDRLRVQVFQQVASGTTTSEERLIFLYIQKAIHTGAQGVSLVFDQKRDQLPEGISDLLSFDEKDRLWANYYGHHMIPCVLCYPDSNFWFTLTRFDSVLGDKDAFLCFTEVEE